MPRDHGKPLSLGAPPGTEDRLAVTQARTDSARGAEPAERVTVFVPAPRAGVRVTAPAPPFVLPELVTTSVPVSSSTELPPQSVGMHKAHAARSPAGALFDLARLRRPSP